MKLYISLLLNDVHKEVKKILYIYNISKVIHTFYLLQDYDMFYKITQEKKRK